MDFVCEIADVFRWIYQEQDMILDLHHIWDLLKHDTIMRVGCCLLNGEGVLIDWRGAAPYFKLAVDEGIAVAQNKYRLCLQNGAAFR
jgi:hypothetical protein